MVYMNTCIHRTDSLPSVAWISQNSQPRSCLTTLLENLQMSPQRYTLHQSSSRSLSKLSPLFMFRRLNLLKLSMLVRLMASKLLRTAVLAGDANSGFWSCKTGQRFLAPTMLPCRHMVHKQFPSQPVEMSPALCLSFSTARWTRAGTASKTAQQNLQPSGKHQ